MKKGVVVVVLLILLVLMITSVALAGYVPPKPAGGCPNDRWNLVYVGFDKDWAVQLDKNLDGYLCVKKNPLTSERFYIDNKYALPYN
jgi:hypothetical protein